MLDWQQVFPLSTSPRASNGFPVVSSPLFCPSAPLSMLTMSNSGSGVTQHCRFSMPDANYVVGQGALPNGPRDLRCTVCLFPYPVQYLLRAALNIMEEITNEQREIPLKNRRVSFWLTYAFHIQLISRQLITMFRP